MSISEEIGEAIDTIAGILPEGHFIKITVERHGWDVMLFKPDDTLDIDGGGGLLEDLKDVIDTYSQGESGNG